MEDPVDCKFNYSETHKSVEKEDYIQAILCVFDIVLRQIVLPVEIQLIEANRLLRLMIIGLIKIRTVVFLFQSYMGPTVSCLDIRLVCYECLSVKFIYFYQSEISC